VEQRELVVTGSGKGRKSGAALLPALALALAAGPVLAQEADNALNSYRLPRVVHRRLPQVRPRPAQTP